MRCALSFLALAATAAAHIERRGDMVLPTKQQGELDGQWEIDRKNVTFSFYFTCTAAECYENVAGAGRGLISTNYITSNLLAAYNQRMASSSAKAKAEFLREIPHNYDEFSRYADAVFAQATAADLRVDRMVEDMAGLGDRADPIYVREAAGVRQTVNNPDYWNVFVRATMMNVPNAAIVFGELINPVVTMEKSYQFADDDFESVIYQFDANLAAVAVNWGSVWVSSTAHLITDQLEPTPGRGHKDHKYLLPLLLGVSAMLLVPIILTLVLVYLKKGTRREESWVKVLDKHVDLMTKRNNAKQSEIDTLKQREEHISKDIRKREVEMQERAAYDLLDANDVDWAGDDVKPRAIELEPEQEEDEEQRKADLNRHAKLLWRVLEGAQTSLSTASSVDEWLKTEAKRRRMLSTAKTGSLGVELNDDMRIKFIRPGSAGAAAGLKVGDLVVGALIHGRGGAQTLYPIAKKSNLASVVGPKFGVFEGTRLEILIIHDADDMALFLERRAKLPPLTDEINDVEAKNFFDCTIREDGRQMTPYAQVTLGPVAQDTIEQWREALQLMKDEGVRGNPDEGIEADSALERMDVDLLLSFMDEPDRARGWARKHFDAADTQKTGSLTYAQLCELLNMLMHELALDELPEQDMKRLFFLMDESRDDLIDFEEFFPYFRGDLLRRMAQSLPTDGVV